VLRIYPRLNQRTAIQFADYVLERLPFRVETIQADNGAEFQSQFHYHLLDKGVSHVYIKPRTPRLNGKVERSHRIDAEEFYQLLDGVVIDDTNVFNDRLREWENFYDYIAPTAAWAARLHTSDSSNAHRPGCKQPLSVAHLPARTRLQVRAV
jgi:transposase InsO family protein